MRSIIIRTPLREMLSAGGSFSNSVLETCEPLSEGNTNPIRKGRSLRFPPAVLNCRWLPHVLKCSCAPWIGWFAHFTLTKIMMPIHLLCVKLIFTSVLQMIVAWKCNTKRIQQTSQKRTVKPAAAMVSLQHLQFWLAGLPVSISNWLVLSFGFFTESTRRVEKMYESGHRRDCLTAFYVWCNNSVWSQKL